MSKKKHTILGEILQVKMVEPSIKRTEQDDLLYELNKLKVTMSASISQDHLSLYLGTVLSLDEDTDFSLIITNGDSTCLIIFRTLYTIKG